MRQLLNMFWFARNPERVHVLVKKVVKRFERKSHLSRADNLAWLRKNVTSADDFFSFIQPAIWAEARTRAADELHRASKIVETLPVTLGGAACCSVLYFLTRALRPLTVVETGVAAGFSSQVILSALEANKHGKLFSSDFPYFRIKNPETFIGIVVEHRLTANWHLYIEGDERNLPRIVRQVDRIDLVHYDSDKQYSGRQYAMEVCSPKFSEKAVLMMDDIHDDSFFHDTVNALDPERWRVFPSAGGYVGILAKKALKEVLAPKQLNA